MYCKSCGTELPEDAIYCPKCGLEVSAKAAVENIKPNSSAFSNTYYSKKEESSFKKLISGKCSVMYTLLISIVSMLVIDVAAVILFGYTFIALVIKWLMFGWGITILEQSYKNANKSRAMGFVIDFIFFIAFSFIGTFVKLMAKGQL